MFEGNLYDCDSKREALKQALGAFGRDAYRILVFHLEERYNVTIEGGPCSSIEDIEAALRDIADPSADLIIARMHSFLREGRATAKVENLVSSVRQV